MANKSSFSASDWSLLKDSPYWVQTAITQAEGRMGMIEKRREAKALADYLASVKSSSELVKAVVAEAKDGKHDVNPHTKLETVGDNLEKIAKIASSKTTPQEYDDFTDFLMDVGNAIASATGESLLNKKDKISDEEEEALDLVAKALNATGAAKAARSAQATAAQRKAIEEQKKRAAAAKEKAEEDKKLADMQKKLEEMEKERERREALAKKQEELREARRKRMAAQREKAQATTAKAAAEANKHTVAAGETLSHIALKYYGNANDWRKIYEANKDTIKNPSLIYPGQELTIPDAE